MEALEIKNLSFRYPNAARKALDGITLSVAQGEFAVICGPSGCGKSTLLRQLRTCLAPRGERTGGVFCGGVPLDSLSLREQSVRIGFVQQSPESQIVTDKVWHELAFGLESLGLDTPAIRRRVAETASFFGMESWFYRNVAELSGGQKQLLNLASVMVMQPSFLVLDEPTSRLDPIAAEEFLAVLGRINRELGAGVILAEQRLEQAFTLAGSVAVMDEGRLLFHGSPREVGLALRGSGSAMFLSMPSAMRVWAGVGGEPPCPVTVRDGRSWLAGYALAHPLSPLPEREPPHVGETAAELRGAWFRFDRESPDILKGLSLSLKRGEILALLGGNGAGKTTALRVLSGALKPYRGQAVIRGRAAAMPQNPQTLFVKKTLRSDLAETFAGTHPDPSRREALLSRAVSLCGLEALLERHPYDLSGGEQQRAALAKLLLTEPDVLLLDEPTKGLDAQFRRSFGKILRAYAAEGGAVLLVSHDLEFCAEYADRCALLFDGSAAAEGAPREFFSGNSFYTTPVNRMSRGICENAVTVRDLIRVCGAEPPPDPEPPPPPPDLTENAPDSPPERTAPRRAPKRTIISAAVILLLIPLTIFIGQRFLSGRKYYAISLLIILETLVPFAMLFEGRRPRARELAVTASLCAIAVAGRAAFFMLPQFKPVMAVTVISGAAFGGETGFLVGAVSMLVSNMLFSQGPWAPYQMFAMGLGGFLAGAVFGSGLVPARRAPLCVYGAAAALVIYGGIMNPASALMWSQKLNLGVLLAYYAAGLPMDLVHAAATAFFLFTAGEPMLEKLGRIKIKYGINT